MVTSNKQSDKKVVKMAEESSAAVVVPQRTLLGEVNEHITCPLCRGYYIDATTIVECLHSFCRSCIIKHLQVKSYCPVCEMMINSAKPNIKLDKALQDIVYKLVPGLFQKEMERRQQFYSSRPGPAACATPEQRGEDTERIIFSPEDVISFSLEYCDVTDTDSISSKSSDSNEPQPASTTTRRYLQCPAVVNINHLKKFLSMKFDIDSTQFAIDILYKRVPLPDYYTLMDIAYIYNWKRNEPMRFFYQITDYVAIRNRLFEINRKGICPFDERKSSPAPTEDTSASSPAPLLNDHGSEVSSGTDSPMPDDSVKQATDINKVNDKVGQLKKEGDEDKADETVCMSPKKNDDDVKKSQFLNSFELTAKSNCMPHKTSPVKTDDQFSLGNNESISNAQSSGVKLEGKVIEPAKRKYQTAQQTPELKKLRVEIEKSKVNIETKSIPVIPSVSTSNVSVKTDTSIRAQDIEDSLKNSPAHNVTMTPPTKEIRQQLVNPKQQESPSAKRSVTSSSISSPKRKHSNEIQITMPPPAGQKSVSPLILPIPKTEPPTAGIKVPEVQKHPIKKMPDLKPSIVMPQSSQNKLQPVNKVRMDLLANNSDPTCDRSKILSQVKTSLTTPTGTQPSGDPLKSLFDSCKINIPSSLSITLTDQKLESHNPAETVAVEPKKSMLNKNLAGAGSTTHKVPSPPVHNYIEILKLPDTETGKKTLKSENNSEVKQNLQCKEATPPQAKPVTKSAENQSSAKGPVPNLKPIADTKLAKQSANFSAPITFQQTFEQQLQNLQSDKKTKLPKNKAQVPKLVPATPKSFSAANKPTNPVNKPNTNSMPILENKSSAALDLSTPHNIQNQLLTMQSIDNLAKKQSLPSKGMSLSMPQSNVFPNIANRPLTTGINPLRIPPVPNVNSMKPDKGNPSGNQINNRHEVSCNKSNTLKTTSTINSPSVTSPGYQITPRISPSTAQPSPRSQTRSPSSSPKLVIAEEKQATSCSSEQISNVNSTNNDVSKITPGPSKILTKPMASTGKLTGIRQSLSTNLKPSPSVSPSAEYLMSQTRPQLLAHHQNMMQLRHQMEMNAWAQRQLDNMYKRSNMAHQIQNEFSNKDKQ
ncbi:unnamed protein product [Arctia plantaginis]|uniref:RING-type domain-containing protein n=1 Tax=Arctia plantaginis TaxID=874455 RepID=A0A8S0ZDU2_ARCPL|nr:unnamed protein product [Arctia plantaginis]